MMEDDEGDSADFDRLLALPKTSNILINQQSAYTLDTCVCACMYICVLKLL